VRFCVVASEADDCELVHVHLSSPFLLPVVAGRNRKASGSAPNRSRSALLEDRRSRFCGVEKSAGGANKAERRREPGARVQAKAGALDDGVDKTEYTSNEPPQIVIPGARWMRPQE
jgi:hypothetical protein